MPKQGNAKGPIRGFYGDDADRIASAVRYVESVNKEPIARRTYRRATRSGLYPAVIKSGNNMAAATTASGVITPSTTTVSTLIPGTGDTLAVGPDITIYNYSTRTMSTAGKLLYYSFFGNKAHFNNGDC